MALTEEQQIAHATKVTASFVPWLMAADMPKITQKWMHLVGHKDYQPEDFEDNWVVQFGRFAEPFILDWHERKTGMALTRRNELIHHPGLPYVSASPDAYRREDDCAVDCKARIAWQPVDEILAFYTPQLIVQRACLQCSKAALVVMHGGTEPKEYEITWEPAYENLVWERIAWFWECVEDLTPPGELPSAMAPVPAVKEYDMASSNSWADDAHLWRANKEAAGVFDKAAKRIKEQTPADAKRAFGHGIVVSRATNGSLTIREKK